MVQNGYNWYNSIGGAKWFKMYQMVHHGLIFGGKALFFQYILKLFSLNMSSDCEQFAKYLEDQMKNSFPKFEKYCTVAQYLSPNIQCAILPETKWRDRISIIQDMRKF